MSKLYHVRFHEPPDEEGEVDYYFGSLSAIYKRFSKEDIGCGVHRLWNLKIAKGKPYNGRNCVIKAGEITRMTTQRGRR